MDDLNQPQTNSSKTVLVAGLAITSFVFLIATGFFFMNVQSLSHENQTLANQQSLLQTQLTTLKDEKAQLEKDLIFYKNTDLAKELEIVNLKLETAEEDLASTKATLDKLKAGISNVPKMTRIASMMMSTFGKQPPNCFSASDKTSINQELTALGDREWTSKWEDFINDTDAKNCSMSPDKLEQVVNYGLTKISEAVK